MLGFRSIKNHPNLPAWGMAKNSGVFCLFLLVHTKGSIEAPPQVSNYISTLLRQPINSKPSEDDNARGGLPDLGLMEMERP